MNQDGQQGAQGEDAEAVAQAIDTRSVEDSVSQSNAVAGKSTYSTTWSAVAAHRADSPSRNAAC